MSEPLHATAIALAVDPDGPLAGVLILGSSGSGKSSLALAAIEACPFRRTAIVADDVVILEAQGERLIARCPTPIAGLIEARGVGPAPVRSLPEILLLFAVDLDAAPARMPEPGSLQPVSEAATLPLYPFAWRGAEALSAAKLRIVARSVLSGQTGRGKQDDTP
jgi:HPr kinase/phosphorylase